jgi:hypothetical protein
VSRRDGMFIQGRFFVKVYFNDYILWGFRSARER